VLTAAIDVVDARVRRLHIGTHSQEVEQGLRALLAGRGWTKINDYPCQSRALTPYGEIEFGDGVQTWLNPAFAPSTSARSTEPTAARAAKPLAATSERTVQLGVPDDVWQERVEGGDPAPPLPDSDDRLSVLKERHRALRSKYEHLRAERNALRERLRALKNRLRERENSE
jgi:hypothetical protein